VLRIKELPESDRPREKLKKFGSRALTDSELLAILLRTGTCGKSAVTLAQELLRKFKNLKGLSRASLRELLSVKGLGEAKAVTLIAALELGRRVGTEDKRERITGPEEAYSLIVPLVDSLEVEEVGIVTLNAKGAVIGIHTVARGGLNGASVNLKEILRPAVRDLAEALILFHNHPSGDPTPSREDLEITRRVKEGAELLGLELIDHIIVGKNCFFSFKGEGLV
jgi:DNA repair protein RadC